MKRKLASMLLLSFVLTIVLARNPSQAIAQLPSYPKFIRTNLLLKTNFQEDLPCPTQTAIVTFGNQRIGVDPAIEEWFEENGDINTYPNLDDLGRCATWLGIFRAVEEEDLGGAITAIQFGLEAFQSDTNLEGEALAYNRLGNIYLRFDRLGQALNAFFKAEEVLLTKSTNLSSGELTQLGVSYLNIGTLYAEQGRYDEAIQKLQEGIQNASQLEDVNLKLVIQQKLAELYYVLGNYEEAKPLLQEVLAFAEQEEILGLQAESLTLLGAVSAKDGLTDEVTSYFNRAVQISEPRNMHFLTLFNLIEGAKVYINLNIDYAEPTLEVALSLARDIGDIKGEATALILLGQLYESQGVLRKALEHYEMAINTIESIRIGAGSEAGRLSYSAQFADIYTNVIKLHYQLNNNSEAYLASEKGRARTFLDSLATNQVILSESGNDDLFVEQPLYSIDEANDTILHYEQVQELLRKIEQPTALISYYMLGDEGSLAFIISSDKELQVVSLPMATPENLRSALLIEADNELIPIDRWLQGADHPHPRELINLYNLLVTPLEEPLSNLNVSFIGIIPHQLLHYVPFTALSDGNTYFGSRYTLFLLPSASSLKFIQNNAENLTPAKIPAFIIGNPETGNPTFPPSTHMESEAVEVANYFNVSPHVASDAQETLIWSNVADAQVVHIAAHGSFSADTPFESAIHLAPSESNEYDQSQVDGDLQVGEIYGLNLSSAELVVLSACQTNIGSLTQAKRVVSAGDDIVSLTRALFFAKTPTVISTLWPVDDATTKQLMLSFYNYWQNEGMSKVEALQAAQVDVQKDHPSPFYWAGFVLSGDPGVPLDKAPQDHDNAALIETPPTTSNSFEIKENSTPTTESEVQETNQNETSSPQINDSENNSSLGIFTLAIVSLLVSFFLVLRIKKKA